MLSAQASYSSPHAKERLPDHIFCAVSVFASGTSVASVREVSVLGSSVLDSAVALSDAAEASVVSASEASSVWQVKKLAIFAAVSEVSTPEITASTSPSGKDSPTMV